jgi:hypothetical protein
MNVGVGQTGNDGTPSEVDDCRIGARVFRKFAVAADGHESIPPNRDRLGDAIVPINRQDVAVQQQRVRHVVAGSRGCRKRERSHQKQCKCHEIVLSHCG